MLFVIVISLGGVLVFLGISSRYFTYRIGWVMIGGSVIILAVLEKDAVEINNGCVSGMERY